MEVRCAIEKEYKVAHLGLGREIPFLPFSFRNQSIPRVVELTSCHV